MSTSSFFHNKSWSPRDVFDRTRPAPTPDKSASPSAPRRPGGPLAHSTAVDADSRLESKPLPPLPLPTAPLNPNPGRRPYPHLRSMSHPFPQLFDGGKQQRHDYTPNLSSRMDGLLNGAQMLNLAGTDVHRRGGPPAAKDFATGNCMTCASLVRWPRDLKVFKCTICLTINDLPSTPRGMRSGAAPKRDNSGHAEPTPNVSLPRCKQTCILPKSADTHTRLF
jgi:hypothetical protein